MIINIECFLEINKKSKGKFPFIKKIKYYYICQMNQIICCRIVICTDKMERLTDSAFLSLIWDISLQFEKSSFDSIL